MARIRDRSRDTKSQFRPATARVLHALASRAGEEVPAEFIAEAAGLSQSGTDSAVSGAKLRIAEVPGAQLVVRRSAGWAKSAQLLGMTSADVEALVGPCPRPASYLGHSGSAGDAARILVAAAGTPTSLATLGAALLPGARRGTKEGRDKARAAVVRIQRERAERGEAETVLNVSVEGEMGYVWGPAVPAGESDESVASDTVGYCARPPMRITLPSADGTYVFTNDGLFRDGALQSRGGSFPNPGAGF